MTSEPRDLSPTSPASPASPAGPSHYVARSATDLVAIVPVVLGFHPRDSVVLLTFGQPGQAFHARVDLPDRTADQVEVAELLVRAVRANRVERTAVLIYTDDVETADHQARVLLDRLLAAGSEVIEVLRVHDGRFFVFPEHGSGGTSYDLSGHPFTAQGVLNGTVVEQDREALAATLVGTDEEDAVAVALAATRFADLIERSQETHLLRTEALWLQRVLRSHTDQSAPQTAAPISAADAGRLLVLASLGPTREVAGAAISRESAREHVDLWRGLVRRAPRHLVPGAGSLLALAAWQHGTGALAWCAVDRCLEVDPGCVLALTVADMLTDAVPPSIWRPVAEDRLTVFREVAG